MTRQALARRKTEQALAVIRQGLSRCAEEQADRDRRARQHEIEVERWQQRYSDLQMENQRLRTALNSECIGCSQHSIPQSRSQDMQLQIQLDIAEHKNNMYLKQIEHFQEEMSWLLSNRESMMYTAIQQEQQLIFVIERDRVTIEDLECRVGQLLLLSTTKQLLHETHIAVHGDHQICLQACLPTLQESPSHNKLLAHPNKDMNALSLESTFLCSEDAGEFLAEKACATQQETQEDRLSCVDHQKTDIEFERNSQTASRTQEEHPVQLELLSRETQTEIVSCNQEVRNDAVINSVSNNIDNVQQFLADLATMNQIIVKLEDERQFLEIENQSQNQKRDGYLCHCSEFAVACDSLSRALNSNTYSYHELKSRCDGALICQKTYSDQIAQLSSELEMEKYRNDALDEVSRQLASKVQTSTAVDSDRLKTLEAQQQQLQQQNSQMIIQRDLLLQRLEDAERRLQRSESRCRDMEESLDEADKIRRRLRELSNELEECRDVNAQLQGNCRQGQEKLEKLKEDYALKLSQLGELEIKCDDLCGQILQLQSEKVTLEIDSKSLVERLQAAADLFNNQVASLKVELADQSDRNAQLDLVVDSLNGQLVDAQDCACELDKKVAYLQSCHSQTVQTCDTLRNQIEELQYSKETALDVAMSTKSQLLEAVSRGDLLEKKIDSLQAVIHNLNFRIETATKESASHQTELAASTDHCAALEREADEAAELVKELRLEVSSLKNDIRDAALQRVDDAQRLEDFTVEIKALKTRLDKSERATKLLQQGLNVNIDTEQIERERNKSKALAKHTALAKKKVKECEKEVSKWKALYQRQVASKFSSTDSVPEVTCD